MLGVRIRYMMMNQMMSLMMEKTTLFECFPNTLRIKLYTRKILKISVNTDVGRAVLNPRRSFISSCLRMMLVNHIINGATISMATRLRVVRSAIGVMKYSPTMQQTVME